MNPNQPLPPGGIPMQVPDLGRVQRPPLTCSHCGKEFVDVQVFSQGTNPYFMITVIGHSVNVTIFNVCTECHESHKIQERNLNPEAIDFSQIPFVVVGPIEKPSPLHIDPQRAMHEKMREVNDLVHQIMGSYATYKNSPKEGTANES